MNSWPVVNRELLLVARRPATYRARVLAGVTAASLCLGMVYFGYGGFFSPAAAGQLLFLVLGLLGYVHCLFSGVWFAADCLSQEKREGTLGLLFLTGLSPFNIMVGKLTAQGLRPLYGLLATVPAPAISFVLGGVTLTDFLRLVLVLANALFYSLSLSVLVSAVSRRALWAFSGAIASLLLLTLVLPLIGCVLAVPPVGAASSVMDSLVFAACAAVSPTHSLALTLQAATGGFASFQLPGSLGASLLGTHTLAWVWLFVGSRLLPGYWRRTELGGALGNPINLSQLLSPPRSPTPPRRPQGARHRFASPALWLAERHRPISWLYWVGLASISTVGLQLAFYLSARGALPFGVSVLLGLVLLHTLLKLEVALHSSRAFAEDRQSGVMELLLTTPLGPDEITRGRLLGLKRQFLGPFLILLVADVLLWIGSWIGQFPKHWQQVGQLTLALLLFVGIQLLEMYALSWLGLWRGLTAATSAQALRQTIGPVLVRPWFALLIVGAFAGIASRGSFLQSPGALFGLLLMWLFLTAVSATECCGLALSGLQDEFRAMAAELVAPPQRGLFIRVWERLISLGGRLWTFLKPKPSVG